MNVDYVQPSLASESRFLNDPNKVSDFPTFFISLLYSLSEDAFSLSSLVTVAVVDVHGKWQFFPPIPPNVHWHRSAKRRITITTTKTPSPQ